MCERLALTRDISHMHMNDIEAALIEPQARVWLPPPSWASPQTSPDESGRSAVQKTENLALRSHGGSTLTTQCSRLAQSWPKRSQGHPKHDTEDESSAGPCSGFGPRQRLAAARREALLHRRVHCLQDVIVMLEEHVFCTHTREVCPKSF